MKADMNSYSDSLKIRVESENLIVIHFHDWTEKSRDKRFKMISTNQDLFDNENDYSYIECIDKNTNQIIFKKPCSALRHIEISTDEKYIIGISNIKLWNPIQLVIFDINGNLLKKRHIAPKEAKFSVDDFSSFKTEYPTQYHYLDSLKRIYKFNDSIYVDFLSMGMPKKIGDAWDYLFKFYTNNHLSDNFSESVTNWIYWYNEKSPDIKTETINNNLISISIQDPEKKWFKIEMTE